MVPFGGSAARGALALATLLFVSCGGSSSETPPPLPPDLTAPVARAPAEAAPSGDGDEFDTTDDGDIRTEEPEPADTWGKPRPLPAPR